MSEKHPLDERFGSRFGINESIGQTFETIWNVGGLYNWRTDGAVLSLCSDNPNDAGQEYRCRGTRPRDWPVPYETFCVDVQLQLNQPALLDGSNDIQTIDHMALKAGFTAPLGNVTCFAGTSTSGVADDPSLILADCGTTNGAMHCALSVPAGRTLSFTGVAAGSSKFIQWSLAWRSPDVSGEYGSFLTGPATEQVASTTLMTFPVPFSPGARAPDGSIDADSTLGPGSQAELRAKVDTAPGRVVGCMFFKWLPLPSQ